MDTFQEIYKINKCMLGLGPSFGACSMGCELLLIMFNREDCLSRLKRHVKRIHRPFHIRGGSRGGSRGSSEPPLAGESFCTTILHATCGQTSKRIVFPASATSCNLQFCPRLLFLQALSRQQADWCQPGVGQSARGDYLP